MGRCSREIPFNICDEAQHGARWQVNRSHGAVWCKWCSAEEQMTKEHRIMWLDVLRWQVGWQSKAKRVGDSAIIDQLAVGQLTAHPCTLSPR